MQPSYLISPKLFSKSVKIRVIPSSIIIPLKVYPHSFGMYKFHVEMIQFRHLDWLILRMTKFYHRRDSFNAARIWSRALPPLPRHLATRHIRVHPLRLSNSLPTPWTSSCQFSTGFVFGSPASFADPNIMGSARECPSSRSSAESVHGTRCCWDCSRRTSCWIARSFPTFNQIESERRIRFRADGVFDWVHSFVSSPVSLTLALRIVLMLRPLN